MQRAVEMLSLAITSECLIDKGAIVVRVDPADRHRELTPHDCETFEDQRLLPGQQWDRLGPSRADIGRYQAPQECPLHGIVAVRDEVHL